MEKNIAHSLLWYASFGLTDRKTDKHPVTFYTLMINPNSDVCSSIVSAKKKLNLPSNHLKLL